MCACASVLVCVRVSVCVCKAGDREEESSQTLNPYPKPYFCHDELLIVLTGWLIILRDNELLLFLTGVSPGTLKEIHPFLPTCTCLGHMQMGEDPGTQEPQAEQRGLSSGS